MICIPLRQKQNLAPTTLLNIISIIKTQNAHYRVDNLYQKFKYSRIWAPTVPNILDLWVWEGTRASLLLKSSEGHIKECSEGQKQNLAPTTHQQFSSVHATNHCIVLPLKKRFIKNLLFQNT